MTTVGGNAYNIPHMHKEALSRNGELPTSIQCSATVFQNASRFLGEEEPTATSSRSRRG